MRLHDPLVKQIPRSRANSKFAGMVAIEFRAAEIGEFDVAVICTDHDAIDYELLDAHCPLWLTHETYVPELESRRPRREGID